MNWFNIIGIVAALLTTFGFVPQIIKMYRSKSSKDVSLGTLVQFSAGTALWTIYGIHIRDLIVVIANVVSFITIVIAIIIYIHYREY